MKTKLFVCAVAFLLGCGITCFAQTKTWTGAGDGLTWTNKSNWSGSTLPVATDTVAITSGAGTAVLISPGSSITVKSIQCSKNFIHGGGTLTLTTGSSLFSGAFTIWSNALLTVTGTGASLTASATTVCADARLSALAGGAIHFPQLYSITNNNESPTWKADGAGSLIDLSAVTNATIGYYEVLYLQAANGGTVDLHHMTTAAGALNVNAADTGSVVNLSALSGRWKNVGYSRASFEAQGGASILIPSMTQMEFTSLRVDDTGVIPTAQLTWLTNVLLTVDGSAPSFAGLTNVDDTAITALNGGKAVLTNVVRVTHGNQSPVWRADGAGSLIDLSRLTNVTVAYYEVLYLKAYNGGTIDMRRASTIAGCVQVDAQDLSSVVNLSALSGRWKNTGYSRASFEAQGGASILIPSMTQMEFTSLRVDDTGVIPTAQLTWLTNVLLTVDGSAPSFAGLTNVDDTAITALNGGKAVLTNVMRVTHGNQSPVWRADGAGSLIDLSRLTNVTVAYYEVLYLKAYNGGTIDMRRVSTIAGCVQVDAQDLDSVVNLSALSGRWKNVGYSRASFEAQGGASILIPNITQMEFTSLRVDDTGVMPTAQLTWLTNVLLTVDGSAPSFAGLTNVDDTAITALNGGKAVLTNVVRVTHGNESPVWRADGAGSLIDLSRLTNVTVAYYEVLYLKAYNGGTIDMRRASTIQGCVQVDAQDLSSVVNLNALSGRWKNVGYSRASFEAQGGATILIPNLTQMEFASLRVDDTGVIPTAQLTLLTNVNLTVDGSAPSFASLTNIDDSWVYAYNGGIARLTNVVKVTDGNQSPIWKAQDSGSLIDLSRLTELSIGYYEVLYVQAYSGGKVDLSGLDAIATSSVQVLSDGSGSVIDLTGLSGFISVGYSASSLKVQNSGTILLGTEAFLLSNVAINIAAGNPVLPPTLVASHTLTLYGRPWHSYWIEKRDSRSDLNPWLFAARVPLTSTFQAIAAAPPVYTELRVWEFFADPPILDLFPATNRQVLMVVYDTPTKTNQLLTSTSIQPGATWQPSTVTVMTNSFRIMGPSTAVDPVRFYRAKRL
jgi:hypothetical protein